jgi:anti-anti-sigma factor
MVMADAPTQFRCDVRDADAGVLVALHGELDAATAPAAEERLLAVMRDRRPVTIDLRGLLFMDGRGVRLIAEVERTARDEGWSLTILPGDGTRRAVVEAA